MRRILTDVVAVVVLVSFFWWFDLSTYMAALSVAIYVAAVRP